MAIPVETGPSCAASDACYRGDAAARALQDLEFDTKTLLVELQYNRHEPLTITASYYIPCANGNYGVDGELRCNDVVEAMPPDRLSRQSLASMLAPVVRIEQAPKYDYQQITVKAYGEVAVCVIAAIDTSNRSLAVRKVVEKDQIRIYVSSFGISGQSAATIVRLFKEQYPDLYPTFVAAGEENFMDRLVTGDVTGIQEVGEEGDKHMYEEYTLMRCYDDEPVYAPVPRTYAKSSRVQSVVEPPACSRGRDGAESGVSIDGGILEQAKQEDALDDKVEDDDLTAQLMAALGEPEVRDDDDDDDLTAQLTAALEDSDGEEERTQAITPGPEDRAIAVTQSRPSTSKKRSAADAGMDHDDHLVHKARQTSQNHKRELSLSVAKQPISLKRKAGGDGIDTTAKKPKLTGGAILFRNSSPDAQTTSSPQPKRKQKRARKPRAKSLALGPNGLPPLPPDLTEEMVEEACQKGKKGFATRDWSAKRMREYLQHHGVAFSEEDSKDKFKLIPEIRKLRERLVGESSTASV